MGIPGLTSFLDRSSLSANVDLIAEANRVRAQYEQQNQSSYAQSISQLAAPSQPIAQSNNQLHPRVRDIVNHLETIEQAIQRHAGKLILLVDGLGFFFELASMESVAGRWLPAYDMLHQRLVCLIEALRLQSIELVIYFDSPSTESIKQSTSVQRTTQKNDAIRSIADKLSLSYMSVPSLTPLITSPPDSEPFSSQSFQRVKAQCMHTFQMLRVSTIICEEEADVQLSRDARKFNKSVYGILSNDSDCAAMVGCRWIPCSSLVLEWGDLVAAQSVNRKENQIVMTPIVIDQMTEALYSHERSRVNFSPNIVNPRRELFNQRYLIGVRCRVWTSGKVAQALGLSSPQQLVDMAILVGNDYTKEFTLKWKSAIAPSKRYLDLVDVVRFLCQPNNRNKRLTDLPMFRGLVSQVDIGRAVRNSLIMYEGIDLKPSDGKGISLTTDFDRASLSASDRSILRQMLARDELPSDTLSIIARELVNVASYPEGSHTFTQKDSDEPRELWLPSTDKILRIPRAAFALFCARRKLRLVHVESGEQTIEEIDLAQALPSLALSLASVAESSNNRLPLLVVPSLSLADRLSMLSQSLSADIDPVVDRVLCDQAVPVWLRFPVIHFRFWRHVLIDSLSVRRLALQPWFEALQDMRLFLHAVHSDSSVSQLSDPIILHGGSSTPLPPMMIAVSLFSQYQSGWGRLKSLTCALSLPVDVIGSEAPMHSMHGGLFLMFLQNSLTAHATRAAMPVHDACLDRLSFITQSIRQGKITVGRLTQDMLLSCVESSFQNQALLQSLVWDD